MLAASWRAVLIVSRPVSSTLPQSSPFILPILLLLSGSCLVSFMLPVTVNLPPLVISSFLTPFHSSLNSVNSSDSRGSSGSHSHSPSSSSSSSSHHLFNHHNRHRYRSSALPQQAPIRLSSISSHDSGFMSSSHDQWASSKSSSPMQAETKVREALLAHTRPHAWPKSVHWWNNAMKPFMVCDFQIIVLGKKTLNQQCTQLFSHTSRPLSGS